MPRLRGSDDVDTEFDVIKAEVALAASGPGSWRSILFQRCFIPQLVYVLVLPWCVRQFSRQDKLKAEQLPHNYHFTRIVHAPLTCMSAALLCLNCLSNLEMQVCAILQAINRAVHCDIYQHIPSTHSMDVHFLCMDCGCQQLTDINSVMFYAPQLLGAMGGTAQDALWNNLIIAAVNVAGTILGEMLVNG